MRYTSRLGSISQWHQGMYMAPDILQKHGKEKTSTLELLRQIISSDFFKQRGLRLVKFYNRWSLHVCTNVQATHSAMQYNCSSYQVSLSSPYFQKCGIGDSGFTQNNTSYQQLKRQATITISYFNVIILKKLLVKPSHCKPCQYPKRHVVY